MARSPWTNSREHRERRAIGLARHFRPLTPRISGRPSRLRIGSAVVCATVGCGGSDAPPAAEPVDGQQAYSIRCGYCHDVPDGVGAPLTARILAGYGTVGALDRYLRVAMPHEAPGSLADAEYEAILDYLLGSRQLVPDGLDRRALPDSARLQMPG